MKEYYVYRYRYHDMKNARWDATNTRYGVDCVPCSILARPGLLVINAPNKKEAIRMAKETYT